MPSRRYNDLIGRHTFLRATFIPPAKPADSIYSTEEIEHGTAYAVLMHAEIESYLEDRAEALLDRAISAWLVRRRLSAPLIGLVCYRGKLAAIADDIFAQGPDNKLESVIHFAAQEHKNRIGANNGIRRRNIAKLFIPLGFSEADLDEALVASLDGFGARRGEIAHKPPARRTVQVVDPVDESITILDLLTELEVVDDTITANLNRIR
jgi:hypothetical protein